MTGAAGKGTAGCRVWRIITSPLSLSVWILCLNPALAEPPAKADETNSLCPSGYPDSFCSSSTAAASRPKTYRRFGLPSAMPHATPLESTAPAASESRSWMPAPRERKEPEFVSRLRGLDDLSVVTFWKNDDAKVYMGLEDGTPGIHLKQIIPEKR